LAQVKWLKFDSFTPICVRLPRFVEVPAGAAIVPRLIVVHLLHLPSPMWAQLLANLSCRPCRSNFVKDREEAAGTEPLAFAETDDQEATAATAETLPKAVAKEENSNGIAESGSVGKESSAFHSAYNSVDTRTSSCNCPSEQAAEPGISRLSMEVQRRMMESARPSEGSEDPEYSPSSAKRGPAKAEEVDQKRVWVENVFEFYDAQLKRKRVQRMTNGDHMSAADFMSMVSSSSAATSSGSTVSHSTSTSSANRCDSDDRPPLSEVEKLTCWAVVVGKLLHSHVLGMDDLVVRQMLHRRRLRQAAKVEKFRLRTSVQQRARTIVDKAKVLARALATEPVDRYDAEWADDRLLSYLFGHEFVDTFLILASTSRRVLASQPMVARAQAPCRVFGDIHGQLRDLLLLLHIYGVPTENKGPILIFNGDFVDRGAHQLEVLGLLLALKIAMPERIVLVRGNHEDRTMNERYGFQEACRLSLGSTWGMTCYEHFQKAFDQMPLACVIEDIILVVHGGIGDGRWRISDLEVVHRPLSDVELSKTRNAWLTNILWSDPILDNKSLQVGMYGVHPSPRRSGENQVVEFGWNVTKAFCARNGLSLVIRSHQSRVGSLGFDVMHDDMLLRVFSARDYEDHENDGAVLLIRPAAEPGAPLLVRPQVLSSVSKARRQAYRGTTSTAPPLAEEDDE